MTFPRTIEMESGRTIEMQSGRPIEIASQNSVTFPRTFLMIFCPKGMYDAMYQTRAHLGEG